MAAPPVATASAALFLDLNGTLVANARQPDAVAVAGSLPGPLCRQAGQLGDVLRHLLLPMPPEEWLMRAGLLTGAWPGVLVEWREHAFVIPHRLAPEDAAVRKTPDAPIGMDRDSVATWARHPLAGSEPVMVGDDMTDEVGMRPVRPVDRCRLAFRNVFSALARRHDAPARLEAQSA